MAKGIEGELGEWDCAPMLLECRDDLNVQWVYTRLADVNARGLPEVDTVAVWVRSW